jgi:hypothetical protein
MAMKRATNELDRSDVAVFASRRILELDPDGRLIERRKSANKKTRFPPIRD